MPALLSSEWLRAGFAGRPVGVDRKAGKLLGYVVAQAGPFKSRGRGEFDRAGLEELIRLGNAARQGMKSRFSHPTECNDGLGKHLGRAANFSLSAALNAAGQAVDAVRADLTFDPTALDTPPSGGKPLGVYVMELAESDPGAVSSSIVVRVKKEYRLNPDGTPAKGEDGEELPPLWRPLKLIATDIVDTGDAVDDLLAAGLPNDHLWEGAAVLDGLFEGQTREEVAGRLRGFLDQYLDLRFGPADPPPVPPAATPVTTATALLAKRQRLREIERGRLTPAGG